MTDPGGGKLGEGVVKKREYGLRRLQIATKYQVDMKP
jgi:hypothetical protein